jgi:hypothetical protein
MLSGLAFSSVQAEERTPFTNIDFGLFLGWGNFIKVENYQYFKEDKTHFLVEVNGMEYKEIIRQAKDLFGDAWKCQMAEHFVESMGDLGVIIGETVDLKLYLFDGGHEVVWVKDVPVTSANLEEIKFLTDFCD